MDLRSALVRLPYCDGSRNMAVEVGLVLVGKRRFLSSMAGSPSANSGDSWMLWVGKAIRVVVLGERAGTGRFCFEVLGELWVHMG